MRNVLYRVFILASLIASGVFLSGCSDASDPGPPLVTISGTVRNIDTLALGKGIRVSLLTDMNYADDTATGDDGTYVLKVPKGSRVWLHTDDFDSSVDDYFPLINFDIENVVANANISNWPIHCCPQTSGHPAGSGAIWDDYLANCDDQNYGDIFNVTDANSSGGNITMLFFDCESNQFALMDSISCSLGSPLAPVAYIDATKVSFTAAGPTSIDCNIMQPGGGTMIDGLGWAQSFVDPAFTGSVLTLTLTDHNAQPYGFQSSIEVPVAPGAITLMFLMVIDGVPNQRFDEFIKHCSFF